VKKESILFYEGELGNSIFLVYQGEFAVEKTIKNSSRSKNEIIITVNSGTILGLEILFGHKKYLNSIRGLANVNSIFKINLEEIHNFRDKMKNSFKTIFQQQKLILQETIYNHVKNTDNPNVTFRRLVKGCYKNKIDEAKEINHKVIKLARSNIDQYSVKPDEKSNDRNLIMKNFRINKKLIDKDIIESIIGLDNNKIFNSSYIEPENRQNTEEFFIVQHKLIREEKINRCKSAYLRKNSKKLLTKNLSEKKVSSQRFIEDNTISDFNIYKNKTKHIEDNQAPILLEKKKLKDKENLKPIFDNISKNLRVSNFNNHLFTTSYKENYDSSTNNLISPPHNLIINTVKDKFSVLPNHKPNSISMTSSDFNLDNTSKDNIFLKWFNNKNKLNNNNKELSIIINNEDAKRRNILPLNKKENSKFSCAKICSKKTTNNSMNNIVHENLYYANSNGNIDLKNVSTISLNVLKELRKIKSVSQSNNINNRINKSLTSKKTFFNKKEVSEKKKFTDHWNISEFPSNRKIIIESRKKRKEKLLLDNNIQLINKDSIINKERIKKKKEIEFKKKRKEELYEGNIIVNFPRKYDQSYKSGKFSIPLIMMGE